MVIYLTHGDGFGGGGGGGEVERREGGGWRVGHRGWQEGNQCSKSVAERRVSRLFHIYELGYKSFDYLT